MRVGILGPLEVRDGSGRPVEIGGTRLRGLLARLALEPGRIVTTATLIDGLWGDAPPASAANALQALVSRLRRALAPAGIAVDSRPAGYRLALPSSDVDAAHAEALVRDARAAADPARAAAALTEATGLWRGDALADLDELPFAGPAAVHLDDLRLTAVAELADAELALGRPAAAVTVLAPFAARNPLREQLIGRYVRSLQAGGRPAEALAAYEETRRALADELGVDPSPELAALHLSLLRGDPPPVPARQVPPEPRNDGTARRRPARRAALTSFVGRDDEVTRVAGMLTAGRLVTVVGPGGAGKTRLSLELADRVDGTGAPVEGLSALVPDGAWPVELAPLRDPQEVAYAVLAALGGADTALMDTRPERLRGRRDATERLAERLADAGLLLILDNCEHLTAAAAAVVDAVLAACPGVRVLATSREPLGVPGEMLAPLPSLGLPPPGTDPLRAAAFPAVRLFADRAAAVRPGFAVDGATVDAIAQVCRRLDGMPLAIELAAARLRSLSVGEIADRLDDRFRLLTGGSRTALPRHQTLRAVVDWSWDLLGEPERAVARRLSVFPGAVTLAAAEEVCAGAGLPVVDVVDLVGSLVDKSLVELVDGDDGPARYRLLETIRVYAGERLAAAGEAADVRARFVARVRRIVEEEDPRLLTADQLPAMARLTAERENVVAAVRYAADARDAVSALRIAVGMAWFGSTQGAHAETCVLLEDALAVPGGVDGPDRTMAYAYLGLNRFEDGDLAGGREAITTATAALPRTFEGTYVMLAMVPALSVMLLGDSEPGPAELDPLLGHSDPWARAMGFFMRGMIRQNEGNLVGAEADLVEALKRLRVVGERWALASVLSVVAEIRALRGDPSGVVDVYEEAIRLATEISAKDDLEQLTARLASLCVRLGDTARARALLAELDVHRKGGPFNWNGAFTAMALADLDRRDGDLAAAEKRLRPAWAALQTPRPGRRSGVPPQAVAWVAATFALVRADQGDPVEALSLLVTGVEHAIEGHDMPVLARVVEVAAYIEGHAGRTGAAATLLGAAASLRGAADDGDPDLIALRAVLRDDPGYERAYASGLAMTRPEAYLLLHATLGAPDPPDGRGPGREQERVDQSVRRR